MASIDVDRLLAEYVSEHREAGAADPVRYLEQLHGAQRAQLAALIDGFLARAPRRSFERSAFRGSTAEALVQSLDTSLRGQAGLWPALLPRLRSDAQLKRSDVVTRLADALGVPEQRERVGDYYHQMEQGLLAAHGVSDRVLAALAQIVKVSSESIRRAGEAIAPSAPGAGTQAVFARAAPASAASAAAAPPAAAGRQAWDEIDRLFLGGQ
jgi:hypothetical protein